MSFSPDGTRIVTGSCDRTAKVWDARTGTALLELKGHTGAVKSVAFSPDGTRIVTGSEDQTAKVWDARTGTALLELEGPHELGDERVVQPGRHADRHRQSRPDGEGVGRADGSGIEGRADTTGTPAGPDQPGRPLDRSPAGNRVELIPLQPDAEELAYRRHPHAAELWRYREGYDAAIEGQRRLRGPVLPQPPPAPERTLIQGRGDRHAPVRPLAPPRRRARRPQGPTGGRSGSPGRLPEAGRNLARIRSSSATTSVGLWFATPGSRTRITSAACAWPRPPAGSSPTMAITSIPWAWPSTAAV